MKKLILLLLFPVLLSAQMQAPEIEGDGWLKSYDAALAEAQKEQKNVLVYFTGSDWCPPCKMLKTDLFDTDEFKTVSAAYSLLYIDIPRNRDLLTQEQMSHNLDILAKHNKKGMFPLLVILNAEGLELDKNSGYSMDGRIQEYLSMLNKHKG